MGQPVAGAKILVGKHRDSLTTTDSAGRFEAAGLGRGPTQLTIRALGYDEGEFQLYLPDSGTAERLFALDFTGYMLPEVVVQARAEVLVPRYTDFERRRELKLGAYLRCGTS